MFGITSQLRRASLSVALNYVEGFARQRLATNAYFLEISYGSLKETEYLILFSSKQGYLPPDRTEELLRAADRIGGMLWKTLQMKRHSSAA